MTFWHGFILITGIHILGAMSPGSDFVSIFTIVLSPTMPTWQLAIYGAWMMMLQFAWFALVTLLLSLPAINQRFQKAGHWIDRVLGVAMTALGSKVIIS